MSGLIQDLKQVIGEIRAMQEAQVSDEYRALAEAVCASMPEEQTPEEQRAWASAFMDDA